MLKIIFALIISLPVLAGAQTFKENFDGPAAQLTQAGWRIPENAELVPGGGRDGSQALHITVGVGTPKYTAFYFPVESGAHYHASVMIKTKNVKNARGAVMFLEWADKDKKHIVGGSHPQGVFGNSDWRNHVVVCTNKMPKNAEFIRVSLGVEGQGEAWFDDFRISRIAEGWDSAPILTPLPDSVSTLRRPEFKCAGISGKNNISFFLELSQNPQFPAAETMRLEFIGDSVSPDDFLKPDKWFFRVAATYSGVALPVPRVHEFTIADHAAAWPPVLEKLWRWSDDAQPELKFSCRAGGNPDIVLSAKINGNDAKITGNDEIFNIIPNDPLKPGIYTLTVTASAPGLPPHKLTGIFSNKQPQCRVHFRDDRVMLINDKAFFPRGAYRDPVGDVNKFTGTIEAGFNLIHDYRFEEKVHSAEAARKYLDAAHNAGLKVFMGVPRSKIVNRDFLWIQKWVASLMDHPALALWYLLDEPELQGVTPVLLKNAAETVRAIDPFHPVTVVYCKKENFGKWNGCHDLQWHDPYPLPDKPLTEVSDMAMAARANEGTAKPVWTVLQAFDYRYWPARESKAAFKKYGNPSMPTRDQSRCMAFLAIAAGSDGLVWYWLPDTAYRITAQAPESWCGIVDTVRLFEKLEPWLLNGQNGEPLKLPGTFRSWSRVHDGKQIIAIINTSSEAADYELPFDGVDFESGAAVQSGKQQFRPYEVRILLRQKP